MAKVVDQFRAVVSGLRRSSRAKTLMFAPGVLVAGNQLAEFVQNPLNGPMKVKSES